MKLDGIHHITAITADAQRNVDFYVGVLGLRLVKKSVNQDDPVDHPVAGPEAIDFWAERLANAGIEAQRNGDNLLFADPEGLDHELLVSDVKDAPLIAEHPEIPSEHALQGFHAVRAFSSQPDASERLLETLGFTHGEGRWEARGDNRGSLLFYDEPAAGRGIQGAGTVHHVAWTSDDEVHEAWRERVEEGGGHPTPVIDLHYELEPRRVSPR